MLVTLSFRIWLVTWSVNIDVLCYERMHICFQYLISRRKHSSYIFSCLFEMWSSVSSMINRYHWLWWSSSACFPKWKFDSDGIVLSSTTSNVCSNESLSKWKLAKSISWRNPLGICGQRLRYLCYSTGSCSKVLWRPAIQHINSSLCLKHARLWDGPCSFFFLKWI